ncbi:Endoribonuclease L-PSP/chorismate mutase-like protein [Dunaliella salina]|uniref:Endoribonuclease L-PSP/chorismate mutase-like protein n=1 Tax=Dunaliella salina TaxID=3046 RepID=A0ABQ7GE33_DUNSA|nr:Endoribonuclease L-PSP/chorismate mutase-like protein [Dunaliella salina]|eukprot:KAF5832858.1 Endoribonuclease L-PSP/chorismate mutase-like protein [Dunaliella salina]
MEQRTGGTSLSRCRDRPHRCAAQMRTASQREVIFTENAPAALGPYSQAIKCNNQLFISGQIGVVPGTTNFASEDVGGQTDRVMENIAAILNASGATFENVVKTTILLEDMSYFPEVNARYGKHFPSNPPARATFAVKGLPLGAKVEIEAIAML